ncbi:Ger(x)C family spore germination protein [Halalkalibacter krulwichiae]|uniref:Spore germination protein B3 n=1 Tax=Halalkalibacter krulwichiae TaxID=199441 RepID=A0A1X9MI08_9BACI|nr:Ger(x)C family spore germination protein [Halalkalibacter krulwichiae]ARK30182.1 Spore germination protein B3 precursor [Halalkalibacter krulwichiae]
MKWKGFLSLVICLFTLTGCWDLVEIEQISFVLASALDPFEDENVRRTYQSETGRRMPKGMFQMTNQVVIPGQIEGGGEEEGSGSGEGPFFNISSTGMTSFKQNRSFATRRSRPMSYEHLKVILINEQLARQGIIKHVLDFFFRDHEMRRDILVLVSEGNGSEILEEKLPLEMMPALSIEMISMNHARGHNIPPPKTIGELTKNLIGHQSYIIPRILKGEKDGLKIGGAAVFRGKENKMVGWLGEYDVQGYSWVTGIIENEVIEATYEQDENKVFVYENDYTDVEVNYSNENGQFQFDVLIKAEGFFVENWIEPITLESLETIGKLEKAVEEEIVRQSTKIVEKMQKEFYADIFKFYEEVKIKDYRYWQEIRDHWDGKGGAFSNATININADVKIRHYMPHEELEN